MKKTFLAALLLLGSLSQSLAHAHVAQSQPPEDAVLKASPKVISVSYTEVLELNLSKLVIKDEAGKTIDTGKLEHLDGNKKTLAVQPPILKPGTYKVEWGAASVDTHRTEGSFSFKIAP